MALRGGGQDGWTRRLQQLATARSTPFWAIAGLIAAFVLTGGLSIVWAALGLIALAAWTARGILQDQSRASVHIVPADQSDAAGPVGGELLVRQMLDAMPDAALLLDAQLNVFASNTRLTDLQPVVPGDHVSRLREPRLLQAVDTAMRTGVQQAFEMRIASPVGRHISGTATPLRATKPVAPHMLIVLRDRTEIEQLAEMRADFVANASHELRTPLASLKGFIETLQGSAKDDPVARDRFLVIMQEQADRMSRLIDDLLSLSRIEMREHVAPTATVCLAAVASEAVTSLRALANSAGIALNFPQPAEPQIAIGDRDELTQVAQNLIQNAIKYGRSGGKVDVSVRQDDRHALLTVADDGIGIPPQDLPRLTERFYRVSAKVSRERGGTGLGLAIVKHIVNRHHGELRIESTLGQGSTFTVILPAA
jgi:two-component system phosphate regulon sensor histidine kinase PhoR